MQYMKKKLCVHTRLRERNQPHEVINLNFHVISVHVHTTLWLFSQMIHSYFSHRQKLELAMACACRRHLKAINLDVGSEMM